MDKKVTSKYFIYSAIIGGFIGGVLYIVIFVIK